MAAEWWLIDEKTQATIARRIDATAASVIAHFDAHANENSLTAAFGQLLLDTRISISGTTVGFTYRNFSEQAEEPATGADGGFIVTIQNRTETVKKAVLFQAKRLAQKRPVKSLTMPRLEAQRLRRQLDQMVPISDECIVMTYTREKIYVIDGMSADDLSVAKLQHVTDHSRLVTVGTYLGKWVARCSRGDVGHFVIEQVEEPRGFLRHVIRMEVRTDQPLMLTEGEMQVDPLRQRSVPSKPRWR